MVELFVYRDLYSVVEGIRASCSESTLNGPPRTGERIPLCLSCLHMSSITLHCCISSVGMSPKIPLYLLRDGSTGNGSDLQRL